ncbi:MAG: hypothetical protein IJH80_08750 [Ruminococcus sp.]|nr:hypothetical protein [Ruminococcus sp.]
MKKIVAGMLAAVMSCALLVGCGDSKYVGKYTAEMMGTKATLELKDDHKAKFMGEGGAKWEVDGDKIVLSDEDGKDDETMEFKITDDGDLEMSESGVTITFEKED